MDDVRKGLPAARLRRSRAADLDAEARRRRACVDASRTVFRENADAIDAIVQGARKDTRTTIGRRSSRRRSRAIILQHHAQRRSRSGSVVSSDARTTSASPDLPSLAWRSAPGAGSRTRGPRRSRLPIASDAGRASLSTARGGRALPGAGPGAWRPRPCLGWVPSPRASAGAATAAGHGGAAPRCHGTDPAGRPFWRSMHLHSATRCRQKAIAVALQTPALLAGAAAFRDFRSRTRQRRAAASRSGILRVLAVHALAGVGERSLSQSRRSSARHFEFLHRQTSRSLVGSGRLSWVTSGASSSLLMSRPWLRRRRPPRLLCVDRCYPTHNV